MQIRQRMDLDQATENDHHPIKPLNGKENSIQSENSENLKPAHLGKNNNKNKGKRGRKRAFGQDLTNQQQQASNQQINTKAKKLSNHQSGFNFVKPQIVVKPSHDENIEHDADKRKNEEELKKDINPESDEMPDKMNQDGLTDDEEEEEAEEEEEEEEGDIDDDDDITMVTIKQRELSPWDAADIRSDIHVTEYIDEIMTNLRKDEMTNLNNCIIEDEYDFMAQQSDLNQRMRAVLIDWLIEVHRKFKLLPSTYFLGISLLDRYLAKRQVHRTKLQLAGCTCLWIASKYHEIYAPEMDDFVYISDSAFCDEDLMKMEIDILKTLSFSLTVPTFLNYAQRYNKISSFYLKKEREVKIISDLIMYCVEHSVMNYALCRKLPSLIGAASFVYSCISTKVFSVERLKEDNLENVIGYKLEELVPVMKEIHSTVKNAKRAKHRAIHKKYCNQKYSNIGKLNFDKLYTSFLYTKEETN